MWSAIRCSISSPCSSTSRLSSPKTPVAEPRYRLLETVRQYALEKLAESGEADAVRARHRDHYTAMAALLDAPARTDHERRVEQAEEDMDNLRAAFVWSLEAGDVGRSSRTRNIVAAAVVHTGPHSGRAGLVRRRPRGGDGSNLEVADAVRAAALADKAVLDAWVARQDQHGPGPASPRDRSRTRSPGPPYAHAHRLRAVAGFYDREVARRYFAEAIGLARAIGGPVEVEPDPRLAGAGRGHCR